MVLQSNGLSKVKPGQVIRVDSMLVEIILNLHVFFQDSQKVAWWLRTANPHFGYIAPLTLIQMGRGKKVMTFITDSLDESLP